HRTALRDFVEVNQAGIEHMPGSEQVHRRSCTHEPTPAWASSVTAAFENEQRCVAWILLYGFRNRSLRSRFPSRSHHQESVMTKTVVCPAGSAPPLAPYSPGIAADGVLYVSGMLAMDARGETVGVGDVRAQARCVLDSVQAVVEAAGGSMADVVYNMIFLK